MQSMQLAGTASIRDYEDDHRDDNRGADRRARGDRDLVHVRGGRVLRSDFAALIVRHIRWCNVGLLQGDHANHDAFL